MAFDRMTDPAPILADLYQADPSMSEDAAALIFAERFRGRLAYCHDRGRWLEFNGNVWRVQNTPLAFHYARVLAREISQSARENKSTSDKARRVQFAAGVEKFSQADPAFARTSEHWDQDGFLLGTPKGTVNLKSGALRPGIAADGITRSTAVAPALSANCPLWMNFLQQSTDGDDEMIRFLQQICGYALTGDTREQALFFIYGDGGNGKGVFLNTLSSILGDYAATATMDAFTRQRNSNSSSPSPEIAMLAGARLVSASETDKGQLWAEARLKSLTGGDPITARFNRQDPFTFQPLFKLIVIGNFQPTLETVDEAMRRRFNMIPFVRKPKERDSLLEDKLKAEWPAILRWMINGCLDWLENGLVRPESVLQATRDYFDDQNTLEQWLTERCDVDRTDRYKSTRSSQAFESWRSFAKAAGEEPGTNKSFTQVMLKNGFKRVRGSEGQSFIGLSLKDFRFSDDQSPD